MSKYYKEGYKDAKQGKKPESRFSYYKFKNDYNQGYLDGLQHEEPQESFDFFKEVLEQLFVSPQEIKETERLKSNVIDNIKSKIEERIDWMEERSAQCEALNKLYSYLKGMPIVRKKDLNDILNSYEFREARAILNGCNTNTSRYR